MEGASGDSLTLSRRVVVLTVSKALEKLMATITVRFFRAEALRDLLDCREESSGAGVERGEAMLVRGAVKGGGEEGEEDPLKNLGRRSQERHWAEARALVRGFAGLQERDHQRLLPDGGDVGLRQ